MTKAVQSGSDREIMLYHRWHRSLFWWVLLVSVFVLVLVAGQSFGACGQLANEDPGPAPTWSWVPLGSSCAAQPTGQAPWPGWSVGAALFAVWAGGLLLTKRHAFNPVRRALRDRERSQGRN